MKIFIYNQLYLGGEINLYKFMTNIQKKYPDTRLRSENWVNRLHIPLISGKIEQIKDIPCKIQFESEIIVFKDGIVIAEFSCEVKGEKSILVNEPDKLFFSKLKLSELISKRKKVRPSLNFDDNERRIKGEENILSYLVLFIYDSLGVKGIRDITKRGDSFIQELKEEVGIDAILMGKSDLMVGIGGKVTMYCISSDISNFRNYKLRSVSLPNFEVYFFDKDRYVSMKLYDGLRKDMISLFHYQAFLDRFSEFVNGFNNDMENDLTELISSTKAGHEIIWQEKRQILETKSLYFMKFSSFISQRLPIFENAKYKVLDSEVLHKYAGIQRYTKQLLGGLSEIKYILNNLNRIIDIRDSLSLRHGTKRVEEGLKILGILGGLAAVLIALLTQELGIIAKFIVICAIVTLPVSYFLLQRQYSKRKKMLSRRHYIKSRIEALKKSMRLRKEEKSQIAENTSIESESLKEEMKGIYEKAIEGLKDEIRKYEKELS